MDKKELFKRAHNNSAVSLERNVEMIKQDIAQAVDFGYCSVAVEMDARELEATVEKVVDEELPLVSVIWFQGDDANSPWLVFDWSVY